MRESRRPPHFYTEALLLSSFSGRAFCFEGIIGLKSFDFLVLYVACLCYNAPMFISCFPFVLHHVLPELLTDFQASNALGSDGGVLFVPRNRYFAKSCEGLKLTVRV